MLPPPTTTATCTPRSTTRLIWVAIASIRSRSAPYSSGPIRASPDSFRRTRRKAGWRPSPSTAASEAMLLFRAHREAREAADHHVLAGLRRELAAELLDRLAVVALAVDVRLAKEDGLVEPLRKPSLGDLRTDVLGLVLRLLLEDPALALPHLFRDVLLGHVLRRRGRDVERHLPGERLEVLVARDEVGLAVDLDEHPDLAPRVDVALDDPLRGGAAGALLGARLALDAEDLDRLLEVAARLLQRALAVHHPRAGAVAQSLDVGRGGRHQPASSPPAAGSPWAAGAGGAAAGSSPPSP